LGEGRNVAPNKQMCADRHFFVKEDRNRQPPGVSLILDNERKEVKLNKYSWVPDYYTLACHMGVWDEGHNFHKENRKEVLVDTNRRNQCFFWRYRRGMLLPAAKVLQEREAQYREARKDRRLTIWGLWIAALALVANVYLTVASQVGWFLLRVSQNNAQQEHRRDDQ